MVVFSLTIVLEKMINFSHKLQFNESFFIKCKFFRFTTRVNFIFLFFNGSFLSVFRNFQTANHCQFLNC